MAILKDLIVNGSSRFIGNAHGTFVGDLTGNADTSTKATQDESGNNIKTNYGASLTQGSSNNKVKLVSKSSASLGEVTINNVANADSATNATKLNNQDPSYYLNYTNLSNKPTIPAAANNGKLTIQGNGTMASEFTANQSNSTTLNIKGDGATTVTKSANNEITISSTNTTYSSKTAVSGGSDISLVTTGEKYTWNAKETTSGAQTKANTAESNAKNYAYALTGVDIADTRSVTPTPSSYAGNRTTSEFKSASAIGLSSLATGTYTHLFTERAWSDNSGGYVRQLAFDGSSNKVFVRYGNQSTNVWSAWDTLETEAGSQAKVTSAIGAIKIGGRNLLKNSGVSVTGTSYSLRIYDWANISDIVQGTEYTVTIEGILSEEQTGWYLNVLTDNPVTYPTLIYISNEHKVSDNKWVGTFIMPPLAEGQWFTGQSTLYALPFNEQHALPATVTRIKIEKGNMATDWTPAPEDVDGAISDIAEWQRGGKNKLNTNRSFEFALDRNPNEPMQFTENMVIKGISADGYVRYANINSYTVGAGTVSFSSKSHSYGIGFPLKVNEGEKYVVSTVASGVGVYIHFADINCMPISYSFVATTFTIPQGAEWVVLIFIPSSSLNTTVTASNIQLEPGEVVTAYEPYKESAVGSRLIASAASGTPTITGTKTTTPVTFKNSVGGDITTVVVETQNGTTVSSSTTTVVIGNAGRPWIYEGVGVYYINIPKAVHGRGDTQNMVVSFVLTDSGVDTRVELEYSISDTYEVTIRSVEPFLGKVRFTS